MSAGRKYKFTNTPKTNEMAVQKIGITIKINNKMVKIIITQ